MPGQCKCFATLHQVLVQTYMRISHYDMLKAVCTTCSQTAASGDICWLSALRQGDSVIKQVMLGSASSIRDYTI